MSAVEEQLIESRAWRTGRARSALRERSARRGSGRSSLRPRTTEAPPGTRPPPAAAAGEKAHAPAARTSVALLVRKTQSLAAHPNDELCSLLKVPRATVDQIWTTVKHIVEACRDLLRDRHLDNVVLCTVYGVCKVNKVRPEVTFKQIIHAYKRQRSRGVNKVQVIRDILLRRRAEASNGPTEKRGDVIKFYNEVFVPRMKSFLLQLRPMPVSALRRAREAARPAGASTAQRERREIVDAVNRRLAGARDAGARARRSGGAAVSSAAAGQCPGGQDPEPRGAAPGPTPRRPTP